MLYIFLLRWDEENPPTDPESAIAAHFAFAKAARQRGAYVLSESLGGASNATMVKIRAGEAVITDGPFAETKEAIGGFYILDCADLDEAIDFAKDIPDAQHLGVEVRPIMAVPEWPYGDSYQRRSMS